MESSSNHNTRPFLPVVLLTRRWFFDRRCLLKDRFPIDSFLRDTANPPLHEWINIFPFVRIKSTHASNRIVILRPIIAQTDPAIWVKLRVGVILVRSIITCQEVVLGGELRMSAYSPARPGRPHRVEERPVVATGIPACLLQQRGPQAERQGVSLRKHPAGGAEPEFRLSRDGVVLWRRLSLEWQTVHTHTKG